MIVEPTFADRAGSEAKFIFEERKVPSGVKTCGIMWMNTSGMEGELGPFCGDMTGKGGGGE
jgi:hypothetical protein